MKAIGRILRVLAGLVIWFVGAACVSTAYDYLMEYKEAKSIANGESVDNTAVIGFIVAVIFAIFVFAIGFAVMFKKKDCKLFPKPVVYALIGIASIVVVILALCGLVYLFAFIASKAGMIEEKLVVMRKVLVFVASTAFTFYVAHSIYRFISYMLARTTGVNLDKVLGLLGAFALFGIGMKMMFPKEQPSATTTSYIPSRANFSTEKDNSYEIKKKQEELTYKKNKAQDYINLHKKYGSNQTYANANFYVNQANQAKRELNNLKK